MFYRSDQFPPVSRNPNPKAVPGEDFKQDVEFRHQHRRRNIAGPPTDRKWDSLEGVALDLPAPLIQIRTVRWTERKCEHGLIRVEVMNFVNCPGAFRQPIGNPASFDGASLARRG